MVSAIKNEMICNLHMFNAMFVVDKDESFRTTN